MCEWKTCKVKTKFEVFFDARKNAVLQLPVTSGTAEEPHLSLSKHSVESIWSFKKVGRLSEVVETLAP